MSGPSTKKFYFTISFIFLILLEACNPNDICKWSPPPENDTYFVIKENDSIVKDVTVLSGIKLYYLDKSGVKVYDPGYDDTSFVYMAQQYFQSDPEYYNSGIMFLRYLVGISTKYEIHKFFLQFPDNDIDTIELYAEKVLCKQAQSERCGCSTPVRVLKFNGIDAQEDLSYHLSNGQAVYVFNK